MRWSHCSGIDARALALVALENVLEQGGTLAPVVMLNQGEITLVQPSSPSIPSNLDGFPDHQSRSEAETPHDFLPRQSTLTLVLAVNPGGKNCDHGTMG